MGFDGFKAQNMFPMKFEILRPVPYDYGTTVAQQNEGRKCFI